MRDIEDLVSPIIAQQFPAFYHTEGVDFVAFTKAYFQWMETQEGPMSHARALPDYRDVDKTIDEFVVHFKEKYLADFPLDETSTSNRFLIKHIMDFYRAKGTEQGLKIFMRAKFGDVVDVYYPGRDVFRLSEGKWVLPRYLELNESSRLVSLVGKEVVGSSSGARAFVENIARRRVAGKYVNVAFISNVRGDFIFSEFVSDDGVVLDAPKITGSLTTLDVLDGGENYSEGDVLTVVSADGKDAKVRVTGIATEAGVVTFELLDGGWGYTTNASVLVSAKVLGVSNTAGFNDFFTVVQPLETVDFISANANFAVGEVIDNYYANTTKAANGVILAIDQPLGAANGTLVVAPYLNSFTVANSPVLYKAGNTKTSQISLTTVTSASGNTVGSNTGFVGVVTVNNSFYGVPGNRIYSRARTGIASFVVTAGGTGYVNGEVVSVGSGGANGVLVTSGAGAITGVSITNEGSGYLWLANCSPVTITTGAGTSGSVNAIPHAFSRHVDEVSLGSSADFDVGTITWPENVRAATDMLGGVNLSAVPYMNVALNAVEYGFPKKSTANSASVILDALTFVNMTIGRIASITNINRGSSYNRAPFVKVVEPVIAGFGRKDYMVTVANVQNGSFTAGDLIHQADISSGIIDLSVNVATGNYEVGEIVWQSNGTANAYGTVFSVAIAANTGVIKVSDAFGASFIVGNTVWGATSNASSNTTAVTANTVLKTAKGLVKAFTLANNTIQMQRITLNTDFVPGQTLTDIDSGATANIVSVGWDESRLPVGADAEVDASVQTANAVVATVEVIDSGIGYVSNSVITLIGANNSSVVTARTSVETQGVSEGYYKDTSSFLSNDKRIHDGSYYQDFSYEIQSKVSLDTYADLLKKVAHVAGTRFFGRFISKSMADAFSVTYKHTLESVTDVSANAVTGAFVAGELATAGSNNGIVLGMVANTLLTTSSGNTAVPLYPTTMLEQSANVMLIVADVSGSFVVGTTASVVGANVGGTIGAANATHLVLTAANNVFLPSDVVQGPLAGQIGFTANSGVFANGATVTQGGASALITAVAETTLAVANVSGTFTVGGTITAGGATGTIDVLNLVRPTGRVQTANNRVVGVAMSGTGANLALTSANLSTSLVGTTLVANRSREKFVVSAQAGNTAVITLANTTGPFAAGATLTGNTSGRTANVQSVIVQVR